MINRYAFEFPDSVLENRIHIALTSLSLSEFYSSYKYLHAIITYIIRKQDNTNNSIINGMQSAMLNFTCIYN